MSFSNAKGWKILRGGLFLSAVTNACAQIVIVVVAGRAFFGIGWPADWAELVLFTVAGVACLASLGVAYSHVIPNFDAAPAFTNFVFLPVIFMPKGDFSK
ncbi:hypothetical protein [Acidovorax sp. BLS4]|uniref:hypothetical protein n=1 Tax=Acidovorax sp. BLS4 TaxID=3273430 RepID=UPI002942C34F|nr:hypothetical protein [Paracidovorax avenae]WOI45616.1 hypothetical protein R1Z03_24790 [Paracidovorax avenae]